MRPLDRPEIQLLLGCARRRMPAWVVAHVARQLRQELNWRMVIGEANRHAALPLLRQNLRQHFWPQTPPDVREYLNEACQSSQQRNLALTAELLRILGILEEAGIPAIPFKGPLLALAAYGSTALRMFGDLDILLHEEDVTRAGQLLVGQGYVPKFTFTEQQERAYRRAECALQLRHRERDIAIELHWALTERYLSINLPIAQFWKRSVPTSLAGRRVLTFAPEDRLLYLCVHGCKHEWERLEWLSSVGALAESHADLSWTTLESRARECGVYRLVKVTFQLANQLLQVPMPAAYRDGTDHATEALVREVIAKIFTQEPKGREHNRGNWYLFLLRTRERWSDKIRIITFSSLRLPHPAAEGYPPLPARLSFLHYVLRPARLLRAALALSWHYWTTERKRLISAGSDSSAQRPQEASNAEMVIH